MRVFEVYGATAIGHEMKGKQSDSAASLSVHAGLAMSLSVINPVDGIDDVRALTNVHKLYQSISTAIVVREV